MKFNYLSILYGYAFAKNYVGDIFAPVYPSDHVSDPHHIEIAVISEYQALLLDR